MKRLKARVFSRDFLAVWIATILLIAFQWLFVGQALSQSGGMVQYLVFDRKTEIRHTVESCIAPQLKTAILIMTVIELLLALAVYGYRLTGILPITIPVEILLTIGCVYQSFFTSPSASLKHYRTIAVGFAALLLGVFFSRYATRMPDKNRRGALRGMLRIMALFLVVSTVWGMFFRVNGSGGYFLGITPAEIYKVFVLAFLSIGLIPMKTDQYLRRYYLVLSLCMCGSLVMLHSMGDAVVLATITLLVILQCKGFGWFFATLTAGSTCCFAFYRLLLRFKPNNYIVKRVQDTFIAAYDSTANANLRRSLIAMVKNGILGSGTSASEIRYTAFNFASQTDYVFSGILATFSVGIGVLVVVCYAVLVCSLRLNRKDAAQDTALYSFTNLVSILIGVQAIIHIGCNMNLIPMTGIVLPLISAGGSNMVTIMLALGLALGRKLTGQIPLHFMGLTTALSRLLVWIDQRWDATKEKWRDTLQKKGLIHHESTY